MSGGCALITPCARSRNWWILRLNRTHLSTTEPEASLVSKGKVRSQLSFKVHRAVDSRSEVITGTQVTSGAVNEGHLLPELIEQHTENTQSQVEVVV